MSPVGITAKSRKCGFFSKNGDFESIANEETRNSPWQDWSQVRLPFSRLPHFEQKEWE
ncbi:MAG: hypothetical protein LBU57_04095 [Dysgonamonadaceae bacterium]|nr:hypothetical protein [Dysgonamonadaceae bacterium]